MALRDYTMLLLVLRAGMRVRQVAWMRVSEVNIEDSTIGIRCMFTGRLEHRKVRRSTMEIIERYMATLKPGTECLFSSPTKKRLSERQIIERFKEWGNRAGVGHITPALLRKTYGARVYVRTKDPLRVARALGVRDIRSVEQFTQFADMTPEEMGLD
jgi:site-specific recombinase XerC